MIQDLWSPLTDDPMFFSISKILAMVIVAVDIYLCGLVGFFAVFCICNLATVMPYVMYAVVSIGVLFAITYGIAHIKLPKEKDCNDMHID